jgi:hypothetical protein
VFRLPVPDLPCTTSPIASNNSLPNDDRPAQTPHPEVVRGSLDAMSTADVDAWLAATRNPKRDVIAAVRAVVMSDERIEEAIKYRAPAFLDGGIMAYFHWSAKDFASLIFPLGSGIPGGFDLLHGTGLQRMIRFHHLDDVNAHRDQLLDIVDAWCTHMSRDRR